MSCKGPCPLLIVLLLATWVTPAHVRLVLLATGGGGVLGNQHMHIPSSHHPQLSVPTVINKAIWTLCMPVQIPLEHSSLQCSG